MILFMRGKKKETKNQSQAKTDYQEKKEGGKDRYERLRR